jgi:hypothetical protein
VAVRPRLQISLASLALPALLAAGACTRSAIQIIPTVPRIVVFATEAKAVHIDHSFFDAIADHQSDIVERVTGYKVVPKAELGRELQRGRSHAGPRSCPDQICQTRVGKRLGATRLLSSRVERDAGGRCALSLTLHDRDGVEVAWEGVSSTCSEEEIVDHLGVLLCKVLAKGGTAPPPPSGAAPASSPPPAGPHECEFLATFAAAEQKLSLLRRIKAAGPPRTRVAKEKQVADLVLALQSTYELVLRESRPRWVLAATCRLGVVYDLHATFLEEAERSRGSAAEAARVQALKEKARGLYEACVRRAKELRVADHYTREAELRELNLGKPN